MPDVNLSAASLLERLGREEQHLKQLGLHPQAMGVRSAITVLLRMTDEVRQGSDPEPPQPLDPST